MEFEVSVPEDGHVSPMMESIVEGLRAGSPHEHLTTFTALFCNGSDTAQVSEGNRGFGDEWRRERRQRRKRERRLRRRAKRPGWRRRCMFWIRIVS